MLRYERYKRNNHVPFITSPNLAKAGRSRLARTRPQKELQGTLRKPFQRTKIPSNYDANMVFRIGSAQWTNLPRPLKSAHFAYSENHKQASLRHTRVQSHQPQHPYESRSSTCTNTDNKFPSSYLQTNTMTDELH